MQNERPHVQKLRISTWQQQNIKQSMETLQLNESHDYQLSPENIITKTFETFGVRARFEFHS
jgi:hypothetical protein